MIIMLFTLILPSMMDLIFLLSPSYFQLVFFNFFLPPLAHSLSSPLPPSSITSSSPPLLPTPFPPFPFPLLFRLPLPTNTPAFLHSFLSSPPPSHFLLFPLPFPISGIFIYISLLRSLSPLNMFSPPSHSPSLNLLYYILASC